MLGGALLSNVSATVSAHADSDVKPFVKVLALGDSFSAGVGAGDYLPGPCVRSPHTWSAQWVERARSRGYNVAYENRACSGATMPSFYNAIVGDQPQLNYVTDDVDLVMMSIGGNDLGFGTMAEKCLVYGEAGSCKNEYKEAIRRLDSETNLDYRQARVLVAGDPEPRRQNLISALRDTLFSVGIRLHDGARIVYLGYPSLVDLDRLGDPLVGQELVKGGVVQPYLTARDIDDRAEELIGIQKAAVRQANSLLAGRGVEIVDVLDVKSKFARNEPLVGPMGLPDSYLWDPVSHAAPPVVNDAWRKGGKFFDRAMEAWTSGYYHPKVSTYAREADLVDNKGGAELFGAILANPDSGVVVPSMSCYPGERIRLVVHDSLPPRDPDPDYWGKEYFWKVTHTTDLGVEDYSKEFFGTDGDFWKEYTCPIPPEGATYGQYEGHLTVDNGAVSVSSDFTIWVTEDGDWKGKDDNCPTAYNPGQEDHDGDGVGDACDSDFNPAEAGAWGDPHQISLDGLAYDFQGVGEFHLLKDAERNYDAQIRYVAAAGSRSVSMWSRFALVVDGRRVEVGRDLKVYLDGERAADDEVLFVDGSRIVRTATRVDIQAVDGFLVQLTRNRVAVRVPPGIETQGLLGNNDDDPLNDIQTASGEEISPFETVKIHGRFADSWRVSAEDSLFTYSGGENGESFTDVAFPYSVVTLDDFGADKLAEANNVCAELEVPSGPVFEDCMYDYLVTESRTILEDASIVRDDVVDPTVNVFDDDLRLVEDFAVPVALNMQASSYVKVADGSRVAGPLSDSVRYSAAVASVPRHNSLSATMKLYLFGPADSTTAREGVRLRINDETVLEAVLDGPEPEVTAGSATVTRLGSGTTPTGLAYQEFDISVAMEDLAPSLRVRLSGTQMNSTVGTAVGVGALKVSLSSTPAEVFPIPVPSSIAPGEPGRGAGSLTRGGADEYPLVIDGEDGHEGLMVDTSCKVGLRNVLVGPDGVVPPSKGGSCGNQIYDELPNGEYRLSFESRGYEGDYTATIAPVPDQQEFDVVLGGKVSPGSIGGVAASGAGELETIGSQDVYRFEVPEGGRTVVFDAEGLVLGGSSSLIQDSSGLDLGPVFGHKVYILPEGTYTIHVRVSKEWVKGRYNLSSYAKPDAESFDYQVGQRITDGTIDGLTVAGAGNLETTSSKDSYDFTLAADQRVAFDGSAGFGPLAESKLVRLADGEDLGRVSGHKVYDLTAGDYRIVVENPGWTGSYELVSYVKPAGQGFDYVLGETVADGKVGGQSVAGAGNLETTSSRDMYSFTVEEAAAWVFDGGAWYGPLGGSHLVRQADGEDLGPLYGHHEYDLNVGAYQIVVEAPGVTGTYEFASYAKPEVQEFTYSLGQTVDDGVIDGQTAAGAGNLETGSSRDVYRFTVGDGGASVVFDGSGWITPLGRSKLVRLADGAEIGPVYGHHEYELAAGDYRIDVAYTNVTGGYSFSSYAKPGVQSFRYALGQKVEDGTIGSDAVAGAGNLETTSSTDVYSFSLDRNTTMVFDGSGWTTIFAGAKLVRLADGVEVGPVYGHRVYDLAAGDYQIVVAKSGSSGSYWFTSFTKPATESFEYQIGQTVTNGMIDDQSATGAGNLETTESKDIYTVTLDEAETVVFDADGWSTIFAGSRLTNQDTGEDLGVMYGHHEFELAPGRYQISQEKAGSTGTYKFTSYLKPDAEEFEIGVGMKIENGKIDGAEAIGAGNLETTASKDIYKFSLDQDQTVWFDSSGWTTLMANSTLTQVDTGTNLGDLKAHREFELAAGDYEITIVKPGTTGTYWFAAYQPMTAGPILAKWNAKSGAGGTLGVPVDDQVCRDGVCWQDFKGGQIAADATTGWITTNAIRERWLQTGGPTGPLGVPTMDVNCTLTSGGCYQKYANGWIYWAEATGAHAVYVPIRTPWAALNAEKSTYGYPTSEQECDQATGICWQNFQGGQIASAGTAGWTITDQIRQRWIQTGGPTGPLGKPTMNVSCALTGGGCYQKYTNGSIYWTQTTGAHAVYVRIRTIWAAKSSEKGVYGYPTAEQTCTTTTCTQTFQGGSITANQ